VTRIAIEFTRFSAFYSPLIMTIAGGFLKDQGLEPVHRVALPGKSAIASLLDGTAQVAQSAPAQGFGPLERGQTPPVAHFAQINERDGFFLTGRSADPQFSWHKLAGREVLVDHGGQPLAMFKYACHKRGVAFGDLIALDAGSTEEMIQAFRDGRGEYIHLQGPAPQQLAHDGLGHVVASVGEAFGPCAFSSLAAPREWLASDMAKAFMAAYRKARAALLATPAGEIARIERSFFPEVDLEALTETIAFYQTLGCWSPHVEITEPAFRATLDIFLHAELITKRHPYEAVVAPPPE
jgi:NitT/TauT family transport system substrate-binding protein